GQIGVRHRLKLGAVDHAAAPQSRLRRDGLRRGRIVARDHDHPDARAAAQRDRVRHRGAQGVREAHEAQKAKVEVALTPGQLVIVGTAKTGKTTAAPQNPLIGGGPMPGMRRH
ncbi:MAG: hypothetical protein MUF22_05375, partial [Chitinispirillaceae bacterium]|nr:hypothetical protein [Chitinispirillaceae bacterium]